MKQEMMGFGDGNGIGQTMSKQFVPQSCRQITMPASFNSVSRMLILTPNQWCQLSNTVMHSVVHHCDIMIVTC